MKPVEFVLWLNGAAELIGDQPPTPEQWATMREKLGEAVGGLVAARLLERAEEHAKADERRKKEEAEVMKQLSEMNMVRLGALSGFQSQVDAYSHRVELEAQKMLGLARAMPAGTALGVSEMPKPHDPGFLNHILGKGSP